MCRRTFSEVDKPMHAQRDAVSSIKLVVVTERCELPLSVAAEVVAEARRAARAARERSGHDNIIAYECNVCGLFHIGHGKNERPMAKGASN